jgi:translocation and assembly module TamB
MSPRVRKILLIVGGSLFGLSVLLVIAGVVIVQSDWFRNKVRTEIISSVEEATGGRAEIGSFTFDWSHLRAQIRNFVIHGLEPANTDPLFRANLIQVDLKLTSPFKGIVDIAYLLADTPQANVMVFPDGRTNIPAPKLKTQSNKSGLETIVDLAIGQFDLRSGSVTFADRHSNLDASGRNLRAQLKYNALNTSYTGEVNVSPLHFRGTDINIALPVTLQKDKVALSAATITTPESQIKVTGSMEHLVAPRTNVQFDARIALEDARRLAALDSPMHGVLHVSGNGSIDENNQYRLSATAQARNVSGTVGGTKVTGVNLDASATADPHVVRLAGLRVTSQQGSITGSGDLREMARFDFSGNVSNVHIDQFMKGYSGVVNGPIRVNGDIHNLKVTVANGNLKIAPGGRGIPVSGLLNVDYNGASDLIALSKSYVQLPHTRIDLFGAINRELQVKLVSRDMADFRPIAAVPVTFRSGGSATVNAAVLGNLTAPRINATALVTNFDADGRPFNRLSAGIGATGSGVTVTNGVLARGALQANFTGSLGLNNWKPLQTSPLKADATVRNADVADVLALAGQSDIQATGAFRADAHIGGTMGSPTGNADISVLNGTAQGEHFDSLTAHANLTDRTIDVPSLALVSGPSRIDANATYQHPINDLSCGNVRAHVASNQIQLATIATLVKERPGLRGVVTLNSDGSLNIQPARSEITDLHANVAAHNLAMEGHDLGDLTATANSAGSVVRYDVNSNFAGSTIRVNGQSAIAGEHETTATASIANLPIDQVLAVVGRRDLEVTGILAANAQLSGTLNAPQGSGDISITKGSAYQEPFDRLQTTIRYTSQLIDVPDFRVQAGSASIDLAASFSHPANDFERGDVRFRVRSNNVQLARFHTVQQAKPGLDGLVQLAADGAATLRPNAAPLFSTLDANLAAKGVTIDKKPLGDLTATAQTQGGEVAFNLTSDLGHSDIRGTGRLQLAGDYPINAQVQFSKVTYSGFSDLLTGPKQPFDATLEGRADISGPLERTDALRGRVELSKLEAHSVNTPQLGRQSHGAFEIHNAAPIIVALDRSVANVQSLRLQGTSTNISVTGTAAITGNKALNLRADGNMGLDLLQTLNPDIYSAGAVTLNAAVTGTMDKPAINGRLQLQNASVNMIDFPNGLSNANGTIQFNGTEAIIQNLTGESGGGKVSLAGFVAYGGPEMTFRVQANADQVRLHTPETVTTTMNARVTLAGTTARSLASGTATITDVVMHSHSDAGSILSQAATPPSPDEATAGPLAGLRFDVRIQSAAGCQIRTNLTEDVQLDANLTLRGSIDHPGMLGRAQATSGEIIFFGSKYTIDRAQLNFYNPQKIAPVLNVDLETTVQGVDVALSVSGPIERLKLTYRSDPPMQFSDLVSLLASGKYTSTTDPVLAARQPPAQAQNFEQMGASTLLGQAVANPVSGRLQRLFGVSKLKIDPQIVGSSSTPQATMTLQQQITRDITFTYMQDVAATNPQVIRIEWALNPQWSAVAQRDLNGMFDLDFYYKKRFR